MSELTQKTIAALLADGIGVRFRVKGDSMHPLICADDYLVVEPANPDHIVNGDVILARAERGLTAHRVVAVARGRIVTRGDNAAQHDAPLTPEQFLGRVTWIERNGRRLRLRRPLALRFTRLWARVLRRFD